jgi:molybdate transport system substrate-binding protein
MLSALLGLVVGCGGSDAASEPLDVYAAASLAEVFPEIDPGGRFSFAGSDELATQIREGAPADVYAAASSKYPQELFKEGLVDEPVTFATNHLVLVVPRANPGAIESVEDVLQPGTRLVIAAEGVPVGDYTRTVLETLGLSDALANVVSNEDDVKGVAGKVALGEADAGFVYATDVTPVADRVRAFELPDGAQPRIEYQVAVVTGSDTGMQPKPSSSGSARTRAETRSPPPASAFPRRSPGWRPARSATRRATGRRRAARGPRTSRRRGARSSRRAPPPRRRAECSRPSSGRARGYVAWRS